MALEKTDRGKFLTSVIFLGFLSSVINLFGINDVLNNSDFYKVSVLIINFLYIVAFLGIWLWKKWGVYLVGLLLVVQFILSVGYQFSLVSLLNQQSETAPASLQNQLTVYTGVLVVAYITIAVLLFWAIKRKWHFFS